MLRHRTPLQTCRPQIQESLIFYYKTKIDWWDLSPTKHIKEYHPKQRAFSSPWSRKCRNMTGLSMVGLLPSCFWEDNHIVHQAQKDHTGNEYLRGQRCKGFPKEKCFNDSSHWYIQYSVWWVTNSLAMYCKITTRTSFDLFICLKHACNSGVARPWVPPSGEAS